ncbi:MAG: pyridoxal-phosphate dependent enzyme, partial [Candidatus Hodarchaeota archaeon]
IDRIIQVEHIDAVETTRKLARLEGIFAGISSGAAVWAALQIAKNAAPRDNIVVVLPDTGERYLTTALFENP